MDQMVGRTIQIICSLTMTTRTTISVKIMMMILSHLLHEIAGAAETVIVAATMRKAPMMPHPS